MNEIIQPRPVTGEVKRFRPDTLRYCELLAKRRVGTLTFVEATELLALEAKFDSRHNIP